MTKLYWGFNGKETTAEKVSMCVAPGWRPLVLKLIEDLFALGWNGTVFQVKEKFGGLRFYIGNGSDEIFSRIHEAEVDSYKTCEVCGKPGRERGGGWIRTLCDEHAPVTGLE